MEKLNLTAEIESANSKSEARQVLNMFRKAVQPANEYGIVLSESRLRRLTNDDVEIVFTNEPEDVSVRGHFCTDEPEKDRAEEDEIIRRHNSGDEWAWFCAKVEVRWKGLRGVATLGCCSYESEEDFKECGEFADLVDEALDDLNDGIARTYAEIAELLR